MEACRDSDVAVTPRPLIAAALLAVVIVGGVAIGMIHAFSEEIGLDW